MKKRIAIISVIFLVLAYIIFNAISYANATLTVHLETADTSNVGYGIGNPLQQGINIWDLRNTANKKNLYCIRADYSDTWNNDGRTTDVNYNLSYDLQNDREKILNYLTDNGNDGDELLKQLLNPSGNAYRQLLWLFDNAYLEEEDAETYLNNLGLYDSSLTSKDIIAVQKAAVWYFTNYRVGNNGSYNRKGSSSSWLYLTTDGGSSFRAISDIGVSGQDRSYEAQLLYDYLVTQAEEQAGKYTASNNYNLNTKPASVDTSGLTEQNGKYVVNAEISSDYDYNIVGPIVIDKNSTSDYSISMTVTNQSGTTIHSSNYSFVDKNGNSLGSVTLKDLVGRSGGFYVKVARNLATTVNIKIEITSNVTKKTLWLKGTESSNQIKLSGTGEAEQPIVEISEAPETETVELTGTPETINIPVTKSWSDSNNQDGLRSTSVTVTLYANNVAVNGKTLTLNSSNSWKGTFTDLPKYKNGIEITYTVKENNPPTGYTPTVSGSITNGFTVTNTHTPETIEIPVTKIWADNNNQDGIRPLSVTVALYADNVAVSGKTLTLNSSNGWKGTFTDLPKNKDGREIVYTVRENNPPTGYTPTVNGSISSGFTVTNTHTPETINIPVEKIWEDNNNQDRIRPASVIVTLYADNEAVGGKSLTLTSSNSWRGTFTNLPKYKDGEIIKYTVKEEIVPSEYEVSVDGTIEEGFTVTNTHIPETIDIPVTKEWVDNNNQDGIRPNSITVKLYADDIVVEGKILTLNASNGWRGTFTDLPKYKNGNEIKYTVKEDTELSGYIPTIDGSMADGFIITNTHAPETIEIPVTKVWSDSENQDGIRPTSVIVALYADGVAVSGKTITLNSSNGWKGTFTDLPKYKNGNKIKYTVKEDEPPIGYTPSVSGSVEEGFTVTNTHVPDTIEIPVTKTWSDNGDQDGIRPTSVTVTLYANDVAVEGKTITLNTENQWKGTFADLPKYQDGKEIVYTVKEDNPQEGYTVEITGTIEEGFTVTNTHKPETISIPVEKVWVDNENQDGIRPPEITVTLYANDMAVEGKTITLNAENEWKGTFADLPKYESGEEIKYTIKENDVLSGYKVAIGGTVTDGFTITNTHETDETSITVTKVWEDNNNQDGIRPPEITATLYANEKPKETITLSEGKWTHTFTGLPVMENGTKINYTIDETEVPEEYEKVITGDATVGFIITNKYTPGETSVTVNKAWVDENDKDELRPDSVEIALLANGDEIQTATLTGDDWTHTFTGLPLKKDGVEIEYTVVEKTRVPGYTSSVTENSNNNFTITNTHKVEKIFDLALRKYITKINNNTLESLSIPTRIPNIDTSRLNPRADAATTTATYKHKKDPVLVAEGDIVTYEITIYNEGEKSGYASQIIDQLPTGLIYSPSTTVSSKDPEGNNKNTYNVTYDPTENKVIFDIVNTPENPAKDLQPFETKLDYETLEIKCKVVLKPQMGETNILTNVAWISGAYDTEDNEVAVDRDSQPENHPDVNKDNMEDYKGNENNKDDLTDKDYHYEGEQDDDDFEKLYVQIFDLSLRKFIVKINDDEYISKKGDYIREPIVDVSPLVNKTDTTSIYNHPKEPVGVKVGDRVTYVIRVYNEGELDGFASEVKDYLPPYLTFIEDSEINEQYGWTVSEDGRVVTTTYLTDKEISKFNGTELDYEDLQIECLVSEEAPVHENLTNIAEISEYKYGDTIVPEDIDSESDNIDENLPEDEDLPGYKDDEIGQDYVPGNEDDDDFEKIYVKQFDLALRKFITQVQDQNITNREPQVKYENGQISYEHTKEPLTVHVGDVVTYTLRIYNEGEVDGYASEISDDIPEFLEFLPENETNINYMWKMYDENGQETDNVEEAKTVKTTYLARENNKDGAETNLLVAFNGTTLHYKDIKIAFRVKDPNSNTYIITNHAQISEDTDEDGKPVDDIDSTPDEWNEGEDDQDIENVKVEYFDLSLLKFVSKVIVIEDGKETVTETGYNGHEDPEPVVKVELHRNSLNDVIVKFGYGITITNEGDIPGYATEITDYVPEGLRFESADNPLWTDEGNNVISTKQLENTLLQPGESATIEVILTWINSEDNLNEKTNTAEISEDDNPYDVPDRDSVPDNEIPGEDDIDIAKVILLVSTGTPKTYFILTLGLLTIVLVGVILIKKFVL